MDFHLSKFDFADSYINAHILIRDQSLAIDGTLGLAEPFRVSALLRGLGSEYKVTRMIPRQLYNVLAPKTHPARATFYDTVQALRQEADRRGYIDERAVREAATANLTANANTCTHCGRGDHSHHDCFQKHLEKRPANIGSRSHVKRQRRNRAHRTHRGPRQGLADCSILRECTLYSFPSSGDTEVALPYSPDGHIRLLKESRSLNLGMLCLAISRYS